MQATPNYTFASDNTSGACPEVMEAVLRANSGKLPSYGEDALTAEASDAFRCVFETDCDVYFVFTGTAANSLALSSPSPRSVSHTTASSHMSLPT